MNATRSLRAALPCLLVLSCGDGSDPPAPTPDSLDAAVRAVEHALATQDFFVRHAKLSSMLGSWGPEASVAFPDLLGDTRLDLGMGERVLLVRYWSQHAPREAALWSYAVAPGSRRAAAVEPAFEAWARSDPRAAAEALSGPQPPGSSADLAARGLVRGWQAAGGDGLVEFIRSQGVGARRQRLLALHLHGLIRREGPESALQLASLEAGDDRAWTLAVRRQAALALATRHGAEAAAWCERACEDGDGVRMLVAQRWAASDGPAALAWAARTPVEPDRRQAIAGAARGWLRADMEGVGRWLEAALEGQGERPEGFDPLLASYAAVQARSDPRAGLDWTAHIGDPAERERLQVALLQRWRARDEAAAEAWLEGSALSEEARARAREPASATPSPRRRRPGP